MKSNILIIALCVAVVALVYLNVRSCRQAPSHDQEATAQASMMHQVADSIRHLQAQEDSLIIRKKDRAIDSLIPLTNMAKKALNNKVTQVAGTIAAGQLARADHDTARILSNCDSLVNQVEIAGRLLGGYEYLNDSLVTMLQEQRRIQDSLEVIHRKEKQLLQAALDSSNARYDSQHRDYIQLQGQANKRWSIGPGGGAFLLGGQMKASVGVTIHYDLIKF